MSIGNILVFITTYQNCSAVDETCILPIYGHGRHCTLPKALFIDVGKGGQGGGIKFGWVQATERNLAIIFLIS